MQVKKRNIASKYILLFFQYLTKTKLSILVQELVFEYNNLIYEQMKFIIPFLFLVNIAYGQLTRYPSLDSNYNYITQFEFNSIFNINPVQNGDAIYSIDKYTTSVIMGGSYPIQIAEEVEDKYLDSTYCIPPLYELYGKAKIEDFKLGDIQNCNSGYDELTYYSFYPDSIFTTDLEIGKTYRIFNQLRKIMDR